MNWAAVKAEVCGCSFGENVEDIGGALAARRLKKRQSHLLCRRTVGKCPNGSAQIKTGLTRISLVFRMIGGYQKLSMTMLPVASAMPAICTGVSFSWKRKQE